MASALPSFASAKETTNYARLCRLLVDVGSQVLRDTFDSIHPPAGLHLVLARHPEHAKLQSLRKKKILNPTQWGKLYPTIPSSVSSAGFDITLLMILLRNVCGLHRPATGWDSLPPPADTSNEANIARVKYYRNTVYGHASQASVDDATFNTYWQDISTALVALGGASYGAAINKLKNECMDPDTEEHYRELLKQWKKDEDSIKDKLEEIEVLLKDGKEERVNINDKLRELPDNIRSHIEEVMKNFMAQLEISSSKDKDDIRCHLEKMMDDLMAQLERSILKDKDDIRCHIKKLENFMAQLERSSSNEKDCSHSTCLWPYQDSSGKESGKIRSRIEKMVEDFIAELKRSNSKDKVTCFIVHIPLFKHPGRKSYNGDRKGSLQQQAWNRKKKKRFKKMAKKDKRRPGGVAGLRALTDGAKQLEEEMTHKDERQPCENDTLSELNEIEKQQAEECLEETTKKHERQPGENYLLGDRNELETRQEGINLNQGKTEKLISRGQNTPSSLKMTHEDEGQPGGNDRLFELVFELTEAEKKQAEKGYTIMSDNKLVEIWALQQVLADMSEVEKQQAKEDLEELQRKTKKFISKANNTAKSLRQVANKLDKLRKYCKIAGTAAKIVGGVLTVTEGILAVLTPTAAFPVSFPGLDVGLAGSGTNIGICIRIVEACINSEEAKKAEKDLQETRDCINDRTNTVQMWLVRKEKARLLYLLCFAFQTLKLSDPVIIFLQQMLTGATGIPTGLVQVALRLSEEVAQCCIEATGQAGALAAGQTGAQTAVQAGAQATAQAGTQGAGQAGAQAAGQASAQAATQAGAQGAGQAGANAASKAGTQAAGQAGTQGAGEAAESGAKAGANAGSKIAGGLIIGISAVFPIWDAIDLGFTIRDIAHNKGSKAASYLREKADELDKMH